MQVWSLTHTKMRNTTITTAIVHPVVIIEFLIFTGLLDGTAMRHVVLEKRLLGAKKQPLLVGGSPPGHPGLKSRYAG